MPQRLRKTHVSIGKFEPLLPQMVDDTVGLGCGFRDRLGLVLWHIEHLDPASRDLHLVVMEISMPLDGEEVFW